DDEEKETLAREALNSLSKVPESADLRTVCKRFEDLRFYEAVVCLPLQKAQAIDPAGDAYNDEIDATVREQALAQREQCYEIIISALRSLKGDTLRKEFGSPIRSASQSALDPASRKTYISQIVQLGVQSPDRIFHEYLYQAMIDLGLENELLEYGGPDLLSFLQSAGRKPIHEVRAVTATTSPMGQSGAPMSPNQVKYYELLARYYVLKRQHMLAAHALLRLAGRPSTDGIPTLEQRSIIYDVKLNLLSDMNDIMFKTVKIPHWPRCQYLSNGVLQAKNANNSDGLVGSTQSSSDTGLLDMLEGKLAVLRFQIKIKEELEAMASSSEVLHSTSNSVENGLVPETSSTVDANFANAAREKANELSSDLKSITQLYNEYAVPFKLWETCLEMLYFANYSADSDRSIVRETWARLLDQAISRGGIAEACSVLKRVGPRLYPGDGTVLQLDIICLHLEKAGLERLNSGVESVGDEDVARALVFACKGAAEPVLNAYDQLLSNGAILPSPNLRLRMLRSVLVVLREWAMSIYSHRMGTGAPGSSLLLGGGFSLERTVASQGIRDKITSVANRYMTEVRRLALPQSQTEAVYRGFKELEESLISPHSFNRF
ncbi:nuclear pore complex protein Nup155-like protein, partial [Trifolium pratense]